VFAFDLYEYAGGGVGEDVEGAFSLCSILRRRGLGDADDVGTAQRAKDLGVINLLALRGGSFFFSFLSPSLFSFSLLGSKLIFVRAADPPRGEEYWVAASEDFQHATDLVRYIRKEYGDLFCIGVAGALSFPLLFPRILADEGKLAAYPEGHADSPDKLADVEYLYEKQQAGADFVVTQLFYDVDVFMKWYNACRERGASLYSSRCREGEADEEDRTGITIPILPGIMPIQNYLSFRRMTNLCGTYIPPDIAADLERIQVRPFPPFPLFSP
jgi:methylenetetrahydrofolate reductase (NADPH)